MIATALNAVVMVLPWPLKRWVLCKLYRYDIHPRARVGYSWLFPKHLKLDDGAYVGHLNFSKGLDLISLGAHARIENLNWITAHPAGGIHFEHVPNRVPSLVLEEHAAITCQHFFDCASQVRIGKFTTVAGLRSQFFTHSINMEACRQDTQPIDIGAYCLVGTGAIVLAGSVLPDYSVASAGCLLNKPLKETYCLYAGRPAVPLKQLPTTSGYFLRSTGFVT